MIKINLLKTFLAVDHGDGFLLPDDEKKQITIDFAKRIALVLLVPAALYFYEGTKLPQLQAEITTINAKIADLKQFNEKKKGLAEEIKKYEEDQKRLNGQMSFMRTISNEKVNELNLFLFLQETTPESVWINRIELKGSELTLNAESDVPTDINKFIDRLATAPLLTGVSPTNQETKFDTIAPGISTTTFNVKASFTSGVLAQ
ncbi:MAG: PilN domain-containing protein [Bdellovibrio sp.]|nr:PilN domain-containing protein [Bdellovibrio sp.]